MLLHSCFSVLLRVCAIVKYSLGLHNDLLLIKIMFILISTATVLFTEPKDATVKANGWAQFICTVHCDYQVNWYMAGHPNAIKRNNTVPGLLIKRRHASRRTETTHFFEVLATEAFNKSTFYCATNVRHQSCSCGTDGRCYSRPALLTGEHILIALFVFL